MFYLRLVVFLVLFITAIYAIQINDRKSCEQSDGNSFCIGKGKRIGFCNDKNVCICHRRENRNNINSQQNKSQSNLETRIIHRSCLMGIGGCYSYCRSQKKTGVCAGGICSCFGK